MSGAAPERLTDTLFERSMPIIQTMLRQVEEVVGSEPSEHAPAALTLATMCVAEMAAFLIFHGFMQETVIPHIAEGVEDAIAARLAALRAASS